MLYNRGQRYRRDLCDPSRDLCDWFAVPAEAVVEATAPFDADVHERRDQPFAFPDAPAEPDVYSSQRSLFEHVTGHPQPDDLYADESTLLVLRRVVRAAYAARGVRPRPIRGGAARIQAEHVEATRAILSVRFEERIRLRDLALTWAARIITFVEFSAATAASPSIGI